jgi:DNA repair exonuclease SbcCD ATPase subunit
MSYQNEGGSDSRAKKLLPWAIAALVALVGTNVATWVGLSNKKAETTTLSTALKKEEDLNAQLELQYKDAIAQLEEMKGKNTELNTLIDSQKEELTKRKNQISGLISSKAKDVNGLKADLARFKAESDGLVAKIAELEQDKKKLGETVAVLTTEKTSLIDNLAKEKTEKEQVITQKAEVETAKAKVETEKAALAKKTEIGSVVHVAQLSIQGFKVRESGKEKERTHARNIDRLKFCFKAIENQVVEAGNETFYLRIIDPTGVAIATQSSGGGVLKLSDGKEVQYTTTKQIEFKNQGEDVCAIWDAKGNANLTKGKYTLEVYNKGYMAGTNTFELK